MPTLGAMTYVICAVVLEVLLVIAVCTTRYTENTYRYLVLQSPVLRCPKETNKQTHAAILKFRTSFSTPSPLPPYVTGEYIHARAHDIL